MFMNLVIAGGGLKIMPAIGALKYLQDSNELVTIKSYYGTSSGSICCLLLVLGYSINNIIDIFEKFVNNKLFELDIDIDNLFENFSMYSLTNFIRLLKSLIGCRLNPQNPKQFSEITLEQLYEKTGKNLVATIVDIGSGETIYANHENFPDLPAYMLIRMSCSIPVVFEPVRWKGRIYVDGGIGDNVPIKPIKNNSRTLCIDIKTKLQYSTINNIADYMNRIVSISINSKNDSPPHVKMIYVTVDESMTMNFLETEVDSVTRNRMIKRGYEEAQIQMKQSSIRRRNSF